ncbi:hypothetical protein KO500_02655 [Cellulophaga baltica]|uniref:hypothetical protein n=1 Tax=Cellulophaga TaxID=104264 RepID=UPI001C06A304|nr:MULTISPECIES: hypothetical protein [Cellulophaga]MBU2995311.1 hypothetical protein [Cellulophaga baltica]MDO6766706.1 hypothetical protein [Cellulophaga sp. 1_MG-2023]
MKNNLLFTFLFLTCISCFSQKNITWDNLADVEFSEKFFPTYGEYFLYPAFSDTMQSLEGKQVTITGYFLNIDPDGKLFIVSKGPMASCFFCGVGGPETAVEVQFKEKPNFQTDEIVTITGTLELNADNVAHFNYIINEAEGLLKN